MSRLAELSRKALQTLALKLPVSRSWVPAATLVVVAFLGWRIGVLYGSSDERITLTVDADIDKGSIVEVFYNERWSESLRIPLRPGERTLYRFEGLPKKLWSLRLDPTNESRARIRIYAISFRKGDQTLRDLDGAALRNWGLANVEVARNGLEPLDIISVNSDPMLSSPDSYDFSGPGDRFSDRGREIATPERIIAASGFLFFLLSGWKLRALDAQIPAAVVFVLLLLGALARSIGLRLGGPQAVDSAIGWANYNGYPKNAEFILFLVVLSTCTLAAVLLGFLVRGTHHGALLAANRHRGARLWWVILGALAIGYVILSFPPLQMALNSLRVAKHNPSYDWMNIFTWNYCVFRGWVPLRDFWYPYGGFSNFSNVIPSGFLEAYAHQCVLAGIFICAVYRLTGRSGPWTLGIGTLTLLAINAYLFVGTYRNFLALDLLLLGLVLQTERYCPRMAIAVGAFGGYCFAFEPNQVFYAAVPLAVNSMLDAFDPPSDCERDVVLRGSLIAAASFVGSALGVVGVLAMQSRAMGLWTFLRQMKPMAIYGAWPSGIVNWFEFRLAAPNLFLWGMLFFVAYGASLRVLPDVGTRRLSRLCLGIGLLAATSFTKQIVRPDISLQLIGYLAIGGLLLISQLAGALRKSQVTLLVLLAGFLSGSFVDVAGNAQMLSRQVRARIASLGSDLSVLSANAADLQTIQSSYYHDETRYPRYLQVIRRLKELHADPVYVLGDDAALYVALGQKPPFYISIYNESPIDAQVNVVEWLQRNRPDWVVWKPEAKEFDGVPHLVRVPLVFEAVIVSYEPFETVGDFEILRRRAPGRSLDLGWWLHKLGSELDLMSIPANSTTERLPACTVGSDCADVLKLVVLAPQKGAKGAVVVQEGGTEFRIRFQEIASKRDYVINLQRVWFWGVLKSLGHDPEVKRTTGSAQLMRVRAGHRLY